MIIAITVRLRDSRHNLWEIDQFMNTSQTGDSYNLPSGHMDMYFSSPIIQ